MLSPVSAGSADALGVPAVSLVAAGDEAHEPSEMDVATTAPMTAAKRVARRAMLAIGVAPFDGAEPPGRSGAVVEYSLPNLGE